MVIVYSFNIIIIVIITVITCIIIKIISQVTNSNNVKYINISKMHIELHKLHTFKCITVL